MKKSIAALTIACFILLSASSQTLFTYGKYKADVNDFLNAYNKNNPGPTTNKSKAVNEYLTLYINSKLINDSLIPLVQITHYYHYLLLKYKFTMPPKSGFLPPTIAA